MRNLIGLVVIISAGVVSFLFVNQPVDLGLREPFAIYSCGERSDQIPCRPTFDLPVSPESDADRVARVRCRVLKDFDEIWNLSKSERRELNRCYRTGRLK